MCHIAWNWVRFSATSFSHSFYLIINGHSKKVEKSWCLKVDKSIQSLCSSFTKEIRPHDKNIKFEPFFMLLHAHMTSQSIRHKKLHDHRSKKCSNRTVFVDFRPFYFLTSYHKNRGDHNIWLFSSDIKFGPLSFFPHAKTPS